MITKNIKDISKTIQEKNGDIKKEYVEEIIKCFLDNILECVADGENVRLKNFGTFSTTKSKGAKIIPPSNGNKLIFYRDSLVLRFRQSRLAKKRINEIRSMLDD
jgi:nucleoid DNA-binding protein